MKVLFVCDPRNFLAWNWIKCLKALNLEIAVFCLDSDTDQVRESAINIRKELNVKVILSSFQSTGFSSGLKEILYQKMKLDEEGLEELSAFDPDLTFSWWGTTTFSTIGSIRNSFPKIPIVFIVGTYPNSYDVLTRQIELKMWDRLVKIASGMIYYSDTMRDHFQSIHKRAGSLKSVEILEPQPEQLFAHNGVSKQSTLERFDEAPHVVFTGTTKYITDRSRARKKDALGSMILELSGKGVHVFLQNTPDLKESRFLHFLPTGIPIQNGNLATYLSQFDAHLVCYNEFNGLTKERVANGLGTRFAYGQTFPVPMALSSSSDFARLEFVNSPTGFFFHDLKNLSEQLKDQQFLSEKKELFVGCQNQLPFESRYLEPLQSFINRI